jgi:PAS domain-containing protein
MVPLSPWALPSLLSAALTLALLVYVQWRRRPGRCWCRSPPRWEERSCSRRRSRERLPDARPPRPPARGRRPLHGPAPAGAVRLAARDPLRGAPGALLYPVLSRRLAASDAGALDPARLADELGADAQPRGGRLYRSAGEPEWVRIESTPIRDARGRLRCRSLRLRDETAFRSALEQAEQQASVLEGVLAATDEGILVHVAGRIHFANPQFHGAPRRRRADRVRPEALHDRDAAGCVRAALEGR